jgi:hypothetical protein
MPNSRLVAEALKLVEDADRVAGLATMYRNHVIDGEIERAQTVRRELDALMLIRSAVAAPLAEQFPRLPRILEILAKVG